MVKTTYFTRCPELSSFRKYCDMKKIEVAPEWLVSDSFDEILKLLIDEETKSIVAKINSEYLYYDKVKYKGHPQGVTPQMLWAVVKHSRLGRTYIKFGNYQFTLHLTDIIQRRLHLFDLNIGGNLGARSIIPDTNKRDYLISSIMEEAIASSQIEGAVTTRKKAKEMLRKDRNPRNKSEQMIVNNYVTIRHIVENQHQPLTEESLLAVHRLITRGTLEDKGDEGRYRTNNEVDVIDATDGEVVHTPPDVAEVATLMNQLLLFFNDEKDDTFIHPIVKGCIIHFMIGFIHPFVDGNGRTARALFYWYLLKRGYWLTEYLSISRLIIKSKTQYAKAFMYTEIDEFDLTYFIHYKLKTMELAFDSLREYIDRKIREKRKFSHFQRLEGVNERQAQILRWMYEEPDTLLTVKEVEIRLNVSNQTARTDLAGLVDKGYLELIKMNQKTRAFGRVDNFEKLVEGKLANS